MALILNQEQAKGLANFFFDLAKGLVLGGVGSLVISPQARLTTIILIVLCIFACLETALSLLGDIE